MADEFNNNAEVQQAINQALNEQKQKKKKKRLIIIGVIVAIIVLLIVISSLGSGNDSSNGNNSGATDNLSTTSSVSAEKPDRVEGQLGDYVCTIKSAEICRDLLDRDSVKITYEFTNKSSEAQSFDCAFSDEVFQDGIGLETTVVDGGSDEWGFDVKIKPGATKEVSKVYLLRDDSTQLEVEIKELISFSDDKLTYYVDLQ